MERKYIKERNERVRKIKRGITEKRKGDILTREMKEEEGTRYIKAKNKRGRGRKIH